MKLTVTPVVNLSNGQPVSIHADADLELIVKAYERAFQAMAAEGAFKGA